MLSEVADVCMIPASNANFFATLRHAVRLRVSSGLESDRSREDIYNERVFRLASWGGWAVGTEWWSKKWKWVNGTCSPQGVELLRMFLSDRTGLDKKVENQTHERSRNNCSLF